MNGVPWDVYLVAPDDPVLVDRTGSLTVATTDPSESAVYISDGISGGFFMRVLIHEIAHCAMSSYGLLDDLHRMVRPDMWVEAEEWVCNFMADYGLRIYESAYRVMGADAISAVPREIGRLVA